MAFEANTVLLINKKLWLLNKEKKLRKVINAYLPWQMMGIKIGSKSFLREFDTILFY
jgi:hypothetical protein